MKNNRFISFLFGLIVLAAIGNQILDNLRFMDVSEDQIELSENTEDSEEEKFEELKWIENSPLITFVSIVENSKTTIHGSLSYHKVYLKIPSPPPDLA